MHVGKSIFLQNLAGDRSDSSLFEQEFRLADDAEDLGFESLWLAEHHFGGYHMSPNVVQMLTYLAGRTTTVRLGSMVIVLPWHEPVRVAEELSVLDHLSRGRVLVGLGRGLGRHEFEGLGVPMAESRDRYAEYADALLGAFDSGVFEAKGNYLVQDPVDIRPRPPSPLRGRAYASSISPDSMEVNARLGLGVMIIAQKPWDVTERDLRTYNERFVAMNGAAPPKPLLVSFVAVHESEAAALEMHEEYHVRYARSTLEWYEFNNAALATVPGYEYYGKFAENIAKHGPDTFIKFLADLQVYGTPDQVVEQLVGHVRLIDAAGVIIVLSFGGMDEAVASANQELFGRAVLPRLQSIDADRQVPPVAAYATSPAAG
jgi:alkanesulfonate monooxygenase SsuD/methylene tetrahydromethanopterin reductase-like flavin-dependent oxidoreductase (luciferase family)